ncbi:dienelactone hydrolase family protein [Streptomyces sp. CA2R106]|uniref:dienelactone hydrolase family protein n=1 Tax=Streptomyces sp. CA2R106 TaxID=3120153 RepID=UPI00300842A8
MAPHTTHSRALLARRAPDRPVAAVLFLHGGRADSRAPSRPWHLAALRMHPFVRAVAAAAPDDVLVGSVRYRMRGWNGPDADPLRDARQALAELPLRPAAIPTILVGHSMGGRAALRAAEAPQVRAVLALAPWCPDGEPVAHLRGKRVVVLHGDRDRVTDPRASASFTHRARSAGAHADITLVPGGDHAMLRPTTYWHRTVPPTIATLLTTLPPPA